MANDEDRNNEENNGMSDEEIDINLIETFPASDPPSWTLGTDHREVTRTEDDKSAGDNEEDWERPAKGRANGF